MAYSGGSSGGGGLPAATAEQVDAGLLNNVAVTPESLAGSGYGPAGVKRYVANCSQSGTDAPVATIPTGGNTLDTTPILTRAGSGHYQIDALNQFPAGRTFVWVNFSTAFSGDSAFMTIQRGGDSLVDIFCRDTTFSLIDVDGEFNVAIVVYPDA